MTRWLAALPLVALAALALLFAGYALHHDPHVIPKALVGKTMPDLTLPTLEGDSEAHLRDALKQGPVLVNFFASWCGPCQLEQPALLSLKAQGVRIVGIDYEDVAPRGSPQNARMFLAKLGDPYVARLADPDGRAGIEFGLSGVPETYLVASNGKVLAKYTNLGESDARALAARMLTAR
ncbi:MAG TPA: DsbE family thiol:disulfide interchange protein [Phenylobacterium sp.]|jgi:cytochrome c biogenesis protein CcmG/thiol:disulfide interchange protein DsbE|nr:DsbE family thiol:disulfide interchange protein [Phenylobacterium sp.]